MTDLDALCRQAQRIANETGRPQYLVYSILGCRIEDKPPQSSPLHVPVFDQINPQPVNGGDSQGQLP